MDRYAVVGNPVGHSKSPIIHKQFAEQWQQAMTYEAILVDQEPSSALSDFVRSFFSEQGKGLNVTVPFKELAWQLAEIKSPAATLAGAVNTLSYNTVLGKILGDNTDGVGLVRDVMQNHQCVLSGQRILVLGAGGAVRGVLGPLLEQSPQEIVIANRTLPKAQQLVSHFAKLGPISTCEFDALQGQFDVIINGTSASLSGSALPVPDSVVGAETLCYDMMYSKHETVFNQWAAASGASRCLDGLGMLVEQAAESFYIWRGFRPDTNPVISHVRGLM